MDRNNFVVVGGSSGIGLEISRRLTDKDHAVLVISRSADRLTDVSKISHFPLDITREAIDAEALPKKIQGLVYCPGTIRLRPFNRLKETDFETDWRINFMGAVNAIQACLPAMKRAEPPASIVLFSTVAVRTGMPFHASIASAKGALEGLTRSLAAEFAPKIRRLP